MKVKLTREEKQISRDLAAGKFQSVGKAKNEEYVRLFREAASQRKPLRKEARINIRLTAEQLAKLKARAEREGLPYQSLVASVLHRYLNGSLVDADSVATLKKLLSAS